MLKTKASEMPLKTPVLYSFRRCPYAMRARLAILVSGVPTELREVVLRAKPPSFLSASPSGTVPCLVTSEGTIDESLDIMKWALKQNDPAYWLDMPEKGWELIAECDGPFKSSLDRTKYISRFTDVCETTERQKANEFLQDLEQQMDNWIFGRPTIADFAIFPFVRQFANIDKTTFSQCNFSKLESWLNRLSNSESFGIVMTKYTQWTEGTKGVSFPSPQQIECG